MNLLSFKAENLFSLGEVDIDLCDRGLVLVTGYSEDEGGFNGSGKSSLANKGILWTLWGETAGGVKADAVVNRHCKKKCYGQIAFMGGPDLRAYVVRRERPAKLTLTDNGVDISLATAKDTQALIDQLLGFSFQTFLQTSFFGQGRNLHYPSLPPKDQKAVLEQILPIEQVDAAAAYADSQIKLLQPKFRDTELQLQKCAGKIEAVVAQQVDLQRNGVAFENQRRKDIVEARDHIENTRQLFRPSIHALANLKSRTDHVDIEKWNIEIEEMRVKLQTAIVAKDEATAKWMEASSIKSQWEATQIELHKSVHAMEKNSKCPTCDRDYEVADRELMNLKLAELKIEWGNAQQNLKQVCEAFSYYGTLHRAEADNAHNWTQQMQTKMREVDEKKSYALTKAQLEQRMAEDTAEYRVKLAEAEARENPYVGENFKLEERLAEAKREEFEVSKLRDKFHDELEHLQHWKQVFGRDIKLRLFEDACPFLDNRTAYHLRQLKNSQIKVEFSTIKRLATGEAKEEFTVNCYSETGGKGFDALSGGEQQMTSFAIGLALADLATRVTGNKSGFMILDEPFTELDPRNGEAVVDYLTNEVKNGVETILLISNDEPLKGLVQKRLHVVKKGGITNVCNS